ncbi:tetraacyldisaccharide 4'-kinase [Noviherbaspirillum sp. 17J57-3]|uniref:Tetraacyldisaccharide 4'-kinase n=2 Tax=Noviherbaspirillum galbum TaxID=2709383 RepID=A0A6B3SI18_9BURK|nr:tetraacyldisaccharide 4'-kinase [Noviherbaspirillum galbum]NEX60451.1 tetraacyldisaccharide 4'-kinase [Noviherbaspirillum galbum]
MRAWSRRGPLACALWPASLAFCALAGLRRRAAQPQRLPVPVIVVGNIFVGGTGKTPFTIWLAGKLRDAGLHPGVISRGYGAAAEGVREVHPGSSPAEAGDEPVLIAQRAACPVMVGRRRVEAGRALLAAHPEVDVIVSDDGLQHYALARDVEIVICDARGNGNGLVLPAGPLREPPGRRRDFTVYNAESPPPGIPEPAYRMRLEGDRAERLSDPSQSLPLASLRAREHIVAAAGIGNPARFFGMLRGHGIAFRELPLPDHFDFGNDPFAGVQAEIILLTEKDAVKCRRIDTLRNDPRLWVVPVSARIDDALAERILEKCRGRPTA